MRVGRERGKEARTGLWTCILHANTFLPREFPALFRLAASIRRCYQPQHSFRPVPHTHSANPRPGTRSDDFQLPHTAAARSSCRRNAKRITNVCTRHEGEQSADRHQDLSFAPAPFGSRQHQKATQGKAFRLLSSSCFATASEFDLRTH